MRRPGVVLATMLAVFAAACGTGSSGSPSPSDLPPGAPIIVTFEVVDERFKALLTQPDDIENAQRLLLGEDAPGIPNGLVIRETGVNEGWTWSLDPDDIEFADVTIEVCDGLPSHVEDGTVTSDRYCPWQALVVEIVPAP
jgi:hypothetical protein